MLQEPREIVAHGGGIGQLPWRQPLRGGRLQGEHSQLDEGVLVEQGPLPDLVVRGERDTDALGLLVSGNRLLRGLRGMLGSPVARNGDDVVTTGEECEPNRVERTLESLLIPYSRTVHEDDARHATLALDTLGARLNRSANRHWRARFVNAARQQPP